MIVMTCFLCDIYVVISAIFMRCDRGDIHNAINVIYVM